jgi:hypothetical protein
MGSRKSNCSASRANGTADFVLLEYGGGYYDDFYVSVNYAGLRYVVRWDLDSDIMGAQEWSELLQGRPPTPEQVQKVHEKSDKDTSPKAQHHSLGPQANQASPGNHTHDGGASVQLLTNVTFTGSRANTAAMITQILAALTSLGATDLTSALRRDDEDG